MPYDALAIANYFLDKAEKEGKKLTPLGLQKLVYFAHGWHLAVTGQPLLNERILAWEYGPVIQEIYRAFRDFGRSPITRKAMAIKVYEDAEILNYIEPMLSECEPLTKSIVDRVWDVYKNFSAIQLSNLTHATGSPWDQTTKENPGARGLVIRDGLIESFFKQQAEANAPQETAQA